ncbi:hypothetical protein BJF92_11125 [Rhizobium rhizosphaerae]|uniref:DUF982 domain-containing protein n=1 Tax=Xaviernesmea rhizosphaerae TaxID=1672749 RepID=A0A1Q9ANF2_9HYPH|nr:hypothetical protein BJF92_11125 [Xaviernesmea rhizosphaerae]OQP88499.1 hypothetical protein BTR14_02710 [Xaviernesmea rhizosphaerae]
MRKLLWSRPIALNFHGKQADVNGPSEALDWMSRNWPDARGPCYVAARSLCRAAMSGRRSPEEAREMFLSAAEEARLSASVARNSLRQQEH